MYQVQALSHRAPHAQLASNHVQTLSKIRQVVHVRWRTPQDKVGCAKISSMQEVKSPSAQCRYLDPRNSLRRPAKIALGQKGFPIQKTLLPANNPARRSPLKVHTG